MAFSNFLLILDGRDYLDILFINAYIWTFSLTLLSDFRIIKIIYENMLK